MILSKSIPILIACLVAARPVFPQRIATISVAVPAGDTEIPVRLMLAGVTHLPEEELTLAEVSGGVSRPVPVQASRGWLYWMVGPGKRDRVVKYELTAARSEASAPMTIRPADGTLTIKASGNRLLRYHYETLYPPAGVDPAYARSGFIHPLWAPHGQELTLVQPKDHYHHYGLWNPWTRVLYEGDTVDFWNLRAKEGTVRFANFVSTSTGSVFGEYRVLHEHVVFRDTSEEVAMNELQTVRVYRPAAGDYYLVDLIFNMNCATESPVHLMEYRYGGLGWRTTAEWDKDNSAVLSSEGNTRKDADGTRARWCMVQGKVGGGRAGVVMMSYPSNYNHPEPLRIWPENQYGRGDMFANFSPTKDKDWLLEPGRDYVLRYRLLVFNGTFTKEQAEAAWRNFAEPPELTVLKTDQ